MDSSFDDEMDSSFDDEVEGDTGEDEKLRRLFPRTFGLLLAARELSARANALYEELDGSYAEYEHFEPGLCRQVEALYRKVHNLKEELGILQEWSVREHRDEVRRAFEQFQRALIKAPPVEPDLFWHADACSRFCQEYTSWYRETRAPALDLRLAPLRTEVARAQHLTQYRVKVTESVSDCDDSGIFWTNDRRTVAEGILSRIPYSPPPTQHTPDEFGQQEPPENGEVGERCTWCGVRAGELHLVDSECRPICYGEVCPQCRRSAISCGHCVYAQEDPTAAIMRAEATGGEPARDDVRPEDDLPF